MLMQRMSVLACAAPAEKRTHGTSLQMVASQPCPGPTNAGCRRAELAARKADFWLPGQGHLGGPPFCGKSQATPCCL